MAYARICLSANHRDLKITLADSDSVGTHCCVLDASKLFELATANIQQFLNSNVASKLIGVGQLSLPRQARLTDLLADLNNMREGNLAS